MRRVRRAEREVEEERPVGPDRLQVADPAGRLVDDVLGDVVAVLGATRRVDVAVVARELGMELVGLALQEAVEAVEALLQRPVVCGPAAEHSSIGARCHLPAAYVA